MAAVAGGAVAVRFAMTTATLVAFLRFALVAAASGIAVAGFAFLGAFAFIGAVAAVAGGAVAFGGTFAAAAKSAGLLGL